MDTGKKYAAIHYANYLELDKILDCQHPRSTEFGPEAHDELLFIITHQAYELWFKQIWHEMRGVVQYFDENKVEERNLLKVNHYLNRSIQIMKLLVHQLEVLETMTPMDFLDFRNYLFPASGFQSFQFRKVEVLLGLKNKYRITYGGHHYAAFFDENQKNELESLENGLSLLELVEKWLERMPFLHTDSFDFVASYKASLQKMFDIEQQQIAASDYLDAHQKQMRLKMLGDQDTFFKSIFDEEAYTKHYHEDTYRISYRAMIGVLFISLYRDEPILHQPYQLIEHLSVLDEFITLWRFRHGQMVRKIIGSKIGTGGSVGVDYLMDTASKHTIFKDIHYASTMMVPKIDLPILPDELKKSLNFYYTTTM